MLSRDKKRSVAPGISPGCNTVFTGFSRFGPDGSYRRGGGCATISLQLL